MSTRLGSRAGGWGTGTVAQTGTAAGGSHNFEQRLLLETTFQLVDPCPTLNGTRRATMPQVLTRRSGPQATTLRAKPLGGHLHLQTQLEKLALVVITPEAAAHTGSLLLSSVSLSQLVLIEQRPLTRSWAPVGGNLKAGRDKHTIVEAPGP